MVGELYGNNEYGSVLLYAVGKYDYRGTFCIDLYRNTYLLNLETHNGFDNSIISTIVIYN